MLAQPLIKDGALISSNRGIKEMKAAAAYLRGFPPEAVEDRTLNPPLLKAVEDSKGNLGYEFLVLQAERVVCARLKHQRDGQQKAAMLRHYPKLKELRRQGVEIVPSLRRALERAPSYAILLVKNAEGRDIESFRTNTDLPIRILIGEMKRLKASIDRIERD